MPFAFLAGEGASTGPAPKYTVPNGRSQGFSHENLRADELSAAARAGHHGAALRQLRVSSGLNAKGLAGMLGSKALGLRSYLRPWVIQRLWRVLLAGSWVWSRKFGCFFHRRLVSHLGTSNLELIEPADCHPSTLGTMSSANGIMYTYTDEAPMLATHAFYPIVQAFCSQAKVPVELKDISVAGRVLSQFPDFLTPEQKEEARAWVALVGPLLPKLKTSLAF